MEYRSISAGFDIAESISAKQADTTAWSKFHLSKGTWIRRGHGSTDDANSLALGARNMEGMFRLGWLGWRAAVADLLSAFSSELLAFIPLTAVYSTSCLLEGMEYH